MTTNEAQILFLETMNTMLKENFDIPKAKINSQLQFNARTTALGLCKKHGDMYSIYLSKHILDGDKNIIRDTLAHELIHTIDGCMNHKTKFKENCKKANSLFGWGVTTKANKEEGINSGITQARAKAAKYVIICPKCKATWYRQRACNLSKYPWRYLCKKCMCNLELIKNN